jgi:hypothetical protein
MLAAELTRSAKLYDEVLVVVGERTRAVLAGLAEDLPDAVCWSAPNAAIEKDEVTVSSPTSAATRKWTVNGWSDVVGAELLPKLGQGPGEQP